MGQAALKEGLGDPGDLVAQFRLGRHRQLCGRHERLRLLKVDVAAVVPVWGVCGWASGGRAELVEGLYEEALGAKVA